MLSKERKDFSSTLEGEWELYSIVPLPYRIDDVTWEGKDIRVMEQVTISPPYLPENVQGNMEKAVNHVRKIVSIFSLFKSFFVMFD